MTCYSVHQKLCAERPTLTDDSSFQEVYDRIAFELELENISLADDPAMFTTMLSELADVQTPLMTFEEAEDYWDSARASERKAIADYLNNGRMWHWNTSGWDSDFLVENAPRLSKKPSFEELASRINYEMGMIRSESINKNPDMFNTLWNEFNGAPEKQILTIDMMERTWNSLDSEVRKKIVEGLNNCKSWY